MEEKEKESKMDGVYVHSSGALDFDLALRSSMLVGLTTYDLSCTIRSLRT